ncbi:type II secretion system protein E [Trinickia terrae]|uniref:Type II secretion system protein E n=1 Tax=Trinickia terrae TaxID=2571161 RepID=A0A4U1I9G5_9BURK|nr:ATPase, T2SS/T4P/T4SS family [Trinickia terrae]TKC90129.1 type II secretion system protein E [Trinickia terrae]
MVWRSDAELIVPRTAWREPIIFGHRDHLQDMMREVVAQGASETILQPGEPVILEIDGEFRQLTERQLDQGEVQQIINWATDNDKASSLLIQGQEIKASYVVKDPVERDARGEKKKTRFRVAAGRGEVNGEMAYQILMRKIDSEPARLTEGELPVELLEAVTPRNGIIWLSGPTGSGKTTFFSAICRHILEQRTPIRGNIVFIEEPIEQTYDGIPCSHSIVFQMEVGRDVPTWEQGVRQLMRRRPKLIVIGETQSRVTAEAAMAAALTGHPVFTTLHCNDVASMPSRILSFFDDSVKQQMLYDWVTTARVLFNQMLVPRKGGGRRVVLREFLIMTEELRQELLDIADPGALTLRLKRAVEEEGCSMAQAAVSAHSAGLIDDETLARYTRARTTH